MINNEVRFDGRVFLVTGGGRGLGHVQAMLLAARGASIVVADNGSAMDGEGRDSDLAAAVAADIRAAGGAAVGCNADLSLQSGAVAAVETCLNAFGHIDGIVHNASPCPPLTPPEALSERDLDLVMRVNPLAGIWMARAAWPHMVRQRRGRIVFMPSAAIYGALGNTAYAAAKSAYLGMTRCLALEGADHGVCVNAIMPSARTRMTEGLQSSSYRDWFFETMPPEKVAVGAAYLLSDDCAVNGEIFSMGGGRIARVMIAEAHGVMDIGASIEAVRDAMPQVLADGGYFFPKDLSERSRQVAGVFGFDSGLEASNAYAVAQPAND